MRHAFLVAVLATVILPASGAWAEEPVPAPAATLFGQPLSFDEAQREIWKALSDQFCATHDCEPADEDYAAFEAGVKRAAAGRPQPTEPMIPEDEYLRLRAELTERINTTQDVQERSAAQDALVQLERVRNWSPGDVSLDVARAMIYAWKFNKALHAEYGGRVIWQQIGLEPIGAYEAWLKEHQAKGSFVLHDPELAERFWQYFTIGHLEVDDAFLKSAGLTHPFEKPWWLMDAPPPSPGGDPVAPE